MRTSEKCRNNNNSDNPLTSRPTDGSKNTWICRKYLTNVRQVSCNIGSSTIIILFIIIRFYVRRYGIRFRDFLDNNATFVTCLSG